MAKQATVRDFEVVLEAEEERGYHVYAPSLKGCHSYGETKEEALTNIAEAIELWLESAEEPGKGDTGLHLIEIFPGQPEVVQSSPQSTLGISPFVLGIVVKRLFLGFHQISWDPGACRTNSQPSLRSFLANSR